MAHAECVGGEERSKVKDQARREAPDYVGPWALWANETTQRFPLNYTDDSGVSSRGAS